MRISIAALMLTVITLDTSAFGATKNESSLQVVGESIKDRWYDRKTGRDVNLIKLCKGSVPKEVDLTSAGLSSDDLKNGVSCVAADFDKNGYLDFVLYGSPETTLVNGRVVPVGIKLIALFYKGKDIVRTQLIHHGVELFVFEPDDPERINYPGHDSSYPALIRPGEGDRGYAYFFNPKTGLIEEGHWVAPPGYEMGE